MRSCKVGSPSSSKQGTNLPMDPTCLKRGSVQTFFFWYLAGADNWDHTERSSSVKVGWSLVMIVEIAASQSDPVNPLHAIISRERRRSRLDRRRRCRRISACSTPFGCGTETPPSCKDDTSCRSCVW